MDIQKQPLSDQHLKVIFTIHPEDYMPRVEEELKTLSKKISLKGFRPGKVPVTMTRKLYGDSVLGEELNRMLNRSVGDFISENKLKVLAQPLPFEVKKQVINIQIPEALQFGYEIGLIPDFTLPELSGITLQQSQILISPEMIEEEVERIQTSKGKRSYPEQAAEEDIMHVEWNEIKDELAEGIKANSSFKLLAVKDKEIRQQLLQLKKGDVHDVNIRQAFGNDMEMITHHLLHTDHHTADQMSDWFRITVKAIIHVDKQPLDQELYNSAFGEGMIHSEDEFRKRIEQDLDLYYQQHSLNKLQRDVKNYLIEKTSIDIPADFLRRWIVVNLQENETEPDDQQFNHYLSQMKWELILSRIMEQQGMKIEKEDLLDYARRDVLNYYGGNAFQDQNEGLSQVAESLLKDQQYVERISGALSNQKVFNWLQSQIQTETRQVSLHEFLHH